MSRRVARRLSVGILIACLASIVAGSVLYFAGEDRIPVDEIVVVGDLSTPGMPEAYGELEQRLADGELLAGAGGGDDLPGITVVVLLLFAWVGIGVLIVWRQPTNWAGWLTFKVTDDGRGFDPEAKGRGTGLQGMADRLDAIGGAIDVVSAPGAGAPGTGRVPVGGSA